MNVSIPPRLGVSPAAAEAAMAAAQRTARNRRRRDFIASSFREERRVFALHRRRCPRHRKHRSMQFSECLPADGISAAAQNGNFGLSCGAPLLPSYINTLVAGRRPMSPNGTTRKALGGAATATAILGTRDVLELSYPHRRMTVFVPGFGCRPDNGPIHP